MKVTTATTQSDAQDFEPFDLIIHIDTPKDYGLLRALTAASNSAADAVCATGELHTFAPTSSRNDLAGALRDIREALRSRTSI